MSPYYIISQNCDLDFLPAYNLGESVLLVRRLSIESLKGLARIFNSLADSLDDSKYDDPFVDSVEAISARADGGPRSPSAHA
jgi:hypothetical protein